MNYSWQNPDQSIKSKTSHRYKDPFKIVLQHTTQKYPISNQSSRARTKCNCSALVSLRTRANLLQKISLVEDEHRQEKLIYDARIQSENDTAKLLWIDSKPSRADL